LTMKAKSQLETLEVVFAFDASLIGLKFIMYSISVGRLA